VNVFDGGIKDLCDLARLDYVPISPDELVNAIWKVPVVDRQRRRAFGEDGFGGRELTRRPHKN
jgi:hypothetical protein